MTQANRQDIVTTSSRNIGIRRAIAEAFIQAILELCTHPKLQYTWMRFLPGKSQRYDPFWSQLVTLLDNKLEETAILKARGQDSLRLISSLRFTVDSQLDRHGKPLFRDNNPKMYISKEYAKDDIAMLRTYGLPEYTAAEILRAISRDLKRSDSRMRSKNMDADWHMRSANYLTEIWKMSNNTLRSKLRSLPLLPLEDETWIAAENKDAYFPKTNGFEVPPELGLNIIASEAAQNLHRQQLFHHLGVKEAEIHFVRRKILDRRFETKSIKSAVKQLKYLFLTDKYKQRSEWASIWIADCNGIMRRPILTDIYMPDDNPYGPSKLLEKMEGKPYFLHHYYLDEIFENHNADMAVLWKNWLCDYVGVRRHLRIISKYNHDELSKECLYVADHLPDRFLGYLRHSWDQESKELEAFPKLITPLKFIRVNCYEGKRHPLARTYLPLKKLKYQWERFSRGSAHFPFLQLDDNEVTDETCVKDWGFLVSSLRVKAEDDLSFYLDVLLWIMDSQEDGDIYDDSRIFELYGVIYGKYLESPNDRNRDLIRYDTNSWAYYSQCNKLTLNLEQRLLLHVALDLCSEKPT